MTETDAMVFVVDDDAPMRESLKNLIRSVGLRVELFASAQGSISVRARPRGFESRAKFPPQPENNPRSARASVSRELISPSFFCTSGLNR